MTIPDTGAVAPGDGGAGGAEVVLSEEYAVTAAHRVPRERVRFTKRIVEAVRTVEVPVRVEQLVVSHEPVDGTEETAAPGMSGPTELEFVLHEEIPVVTLRVEPVERIRVHVVQVDGEVDVEVGVESERAEVDVVQTVGEEGS